MRVVQEHPQGRDVLFVHWGDWRIVVAEIAGVFRKVVLMTETVPSASGMACVDSVDRQFGRAK